MKLPQSKTHGFRMTVLPYLVLGLFVAQSASAQELVRDFSGTDNTVTAEFKVEAPWLLDWRLDADFDQLVALDITLVDARTGLNVGRVLNTRQRGNGVKLFETSGTYRLRISSTLARWRVRIQQITPEQAETYTPRGGGPATPQK